MSGPFSRDPGTSRTKILHLHDTGVTTPLPGTDTLTASESCDPQRHLGGRTT